MLRSQPSATTSSTWVRACSGTRFTPGSVAGYSGANFTYLSSNLDFSGDADLNPRFTNTVGNGATPTPEANTLKGRIAPAVVINEGGEKIGIVGATTQILEATLISDRN